jgi:hypothetical protein
MVERVMVERNGHRPAAAGPDRSGGRRSDFPARRGARLHPGNHQLVRPDGVRGARVRRDAARPVPGVGAAQPGAPGVRRRRDCSRTDRSRSTELLVWGGVVYAVLWLHGLLIPTTSGQLRPGQHRRQLAAPRAGHRHDRSRRPARPPGGPRPLTAAGCSAPQGGRPPTAVMHPRGRSHRPAPAAPDRSSARS